MHLVHVWKNEGLPIVEMQKRLKLRKLSQEAVDDMLYGTPDDAEDFLIHPDDEAAVNIYLFDALTQGVSIEDVRRKLLEEGWPRVVVEKKLRERFKK